MWLLVVLIKSFKVAEVIHTRARSWKLGPQTQSKEKEWGRQDMIGRHPSHALLTEHAEREPTYSTGTADLPIKTKFRVIPHTHKMPVQEQCWQGTAEPAAAVWGTLPWSRKIPVLAFLGFWFSIFQSIAPIRTYVLEGIWQSGFWRYSPQSPEIRPNSFFQCALLKQREDWKTFPGVSEIPVLTCRAFTVFTLLRESEGHLLREPWTPRWTQNPPESVAGPNCLLRGEKTPTWSTDTAGSCAPSSGVSEKDSLEKCKMKIH